MNKGKIMYIMMKIDKDVPLDGFPRSHGRYPWRSLEVGDSFMVEADDLPGPIQSLRGLAWATGVRLGRKFSCHRTVTGGVRVWRVQ